ncbi:MAG TPA: ABC transporter ATP-binding protein [Dissulfurispiraceae bacterium]|nr:ABC transporter ATP-binding protein [Dissulfurispiraceae bacterium]
MMKPLITVEGLHKSFLTPAGELRVLKGIDMSFAEGEMVAVVGASGAGKSTFLHILGTLDRPTQGKIIYDVDGQVDPFSLGNGSVAAFRNRMTGFVFQFHYLLPEFSALENVLMPGLIYRSLPEADRSRFGSDKFRDMKDLTDKALQLLEVLGLSQRRTHKPGELSGGEQQRVAVARALLLEPRVVFADEPTGNLDTATGEGLFNQLMDINEKHGVTFVIVTHNESLSRRCHRIVEMADGKLLTMRNVH